jgi:hypothetical protein
VLVESMCEYTCIDSDVLTGSTLYTLLYCTILYWQEATNSVCICIGSDLLTVVGMPAVDPLLKRAQFNQKINNLTQVTDNSKC